MNVMKYNGFIGTVAYSEEDDVFLLRRRILRVYGRRMEPRKPFLRPSGRRVEIHQGKRHRYGEIPLRQGVLG